ncbi:MAG: 2-phospho-L-lactate transferase [Anaerolinea sp.]|nr:2-phospho-L-lactate transferase [Anaerolinea sp.]
MKVAALAGGVGGAKLVDGLARLLAPDDLTVIVNTGDDFRYCGLSISPDLDTVCYTLAGIANQETGWGLQNETWITLSQLKTMGAPAWFNLGDKDLATHLERTRLLDDGVPLSSITRGFCEAWGVKPTILPMTDDPVATVVIDTAGNRLDFQEYFVKYHWEPAVKAIEFSGIDKANPAPGVLDALKDCDLVVICPSNPYVSVAPILALPGVLHIVQQKPVVAVSPIIGGAAVKGPLAKMIGELAGQPATAGFAANYYKKLSILTGYVLDTRDELEGTLLEGWGIIYETVDTLMISTDDRMRVANTVLELASEIYGDK